LPIFCQISAKNCEIWLKIDEVWHNSASQKIPGLLTYTLPTVVKTSFGLHIFAGFRLIQAIMIKKMLPSNSRYGFLAISV